MAPGGLPGPGAARRAGAGRGQGCPASVIDVLDLDQDELLRTEPVHEPLVVAGVRCHGGLRADGSYVSPRCAVRVPAIATWQAAHRARFGTDLLEAPIDSWPAAYPNVAQTKVLLRHGVRQPVVSILTRIGTVEGFGAMLRHLAPGAAAPADLQACFVEDIAGTASAHLARGLIEAHARDEAGFGDEAGHATMWWVARDAAFEHPVTSDQSAELLARMGIGRAGAPGAGGQPPFTPVVPELDPGLEMLLTTMIRVLFIEVRAYHVFAWAEEVLADPDLVAGDGLAAWLVACIRQDEHPHVEYLRTALSEMRDRTFVGRSGRRLAGTEVVGRLWDRLLHEALTVRDAEVRAVHRAEVERALAGRRDGPAILDEFDALAHTSPGHEEHAR